MFVAIVISMSHLNYIFIYGELRAKSCLFFVNQFLVKCTIYVRSDFIVDWKNLFVAGGSGFLENELFKNKNKDMYRLQIVLLYFIFVIYYLWSVFIKQIAVY